MYSSDQCCGVGAAIIMVEANPESQHDAPTAPDTNLTYNIGGLLKMSKAVIASKN
jgi:hypothetical protein